MPRFSLARWSFAAILCLPLVAAAQQPKLPIPGVQGVPKGLEDFSEPQKFFEPFLGENFGGKVDPAELDKVEFTWKEEQKYGAAQLEALRRDFKQRRIALTVKGKDAEYVARLVAAIRPRMRQHVRYQELHVYIAETDVTDAYTFAGGHLLVSRGMLEVVGSEAALVCVLGHELSHLDRGHLVRQPKQVKLAQKSLKSGERGFTFDDFVSKTRTMTGLFRPPFGPEEELQADRDGITWAYKLGYDPRALGDLFDHLAAKNNNPALAFMPAFLRTHPPSAERKEQVAAVFGELQGAEPRGELYLGRQNLQRQLTKEQNRLE
ncbi:MAG TPA: M48 family metallopeptidase [Pirellulaceae bacterium]|nr:M48 family metallopeptidase [Pirellulaceae bacterium]